MRLFSVIEPTTSGLVKSILWEENHDALPNSLKERNLFSAYSAEI